MDIRYAAAFFVSFIVTALSGPLLISALRRVNAGQTIREDGPVWHNKKQGTPTMGGFMFVIGSSIACVTAGFGLMRNNDFTHIYILLFSYIFTAIGFFDDLNKVKKKQNLGLNAKQKFLLQLFVSLLFLLVLRMTGRLIPILHIPFVNIIIPLPEPVYLGFCAFVAVGTVNAVNITDGADGLATGVTIPVALCFVLIAALYNFASMGVFASALTGTLLGFLIYNFYPAKIFMGDTGSHFLGAAVCALAFAINMPLILVPLGIVYIIEVLSDFIQVTYFKISKGKRVFKMAPIHHHFEMIGWSEYKLFTVFTSVSALFSLLTYFAMRDWS